MQDSHIISIHQSYDIGYICSSIENNTIDVNAPYQRNLVWDVERKYGLIDTILNGLHLPEILARQLENGQLRIIDGKQRLSTIMEYRNNSFKCDDKYYKNLTQKEQLFYDRKPVLMTIYKNINDLVEADIFSRIQYSEMLMLGERLKAYYKSDLYKSVVVIKTEYPTIYDTFMQIFDGYKKKPTYTPLRHGFNVLIGKYLCALCASDSKEFKYIDNPSSNKHIIEAFKKNIFTPNDKIIMKCVTAIYHVFNCLVKIDNEKYLIEIMDVLFMCFINIKTINKQHYKVASQYIDGHIKYFERKGKNNIKDIVNKVTHHLLRNC